MTDNEKRAHDLAVAICIDVCQMKRSLQLAKGETTISTSYFEEYINAYEGALEGLNEKFPDGK